MIDSSLVVLSIGTFWPTLTPFTYYLFIHSVDIYRDARDGSPLVVNKNMWSSVFFLDMPANERKIYYLNKQIRIVIIV